jgi:hypothetical protein
MTMSIRCSPKLTLANIIAAIVRWVRDNEEYGVETLLMTRNRDDLETILA